MNFLCQGHRQLLAQTPNAKTLSVWNDWMNQADLHYELHQWHKATSYIGCAFELSCLRLSQRDHTDLRCNTLHQITLSAIYLHHCFLHLQDPIRAELTLSLAEQILLSHWSKHPQSQAHAECINKLNNSNTHTSLLYQHLQLSFTETQHSAAQMSSDQLLNNKKCEATINMH